MSIISSYRIQNKLVALILGVTTTLIPIAVTMAPPKTEAATVSELEKKKKAAEETAKRAAAEAAKQKELADQAAKKVKEVSSAIQEIEESLTNTSSSILSTQEQIEQRNQQVAQLVSDLSRIESQQDALVRQLQILHSQSEHMAAFSSGDISEREKRQAQYTALKKSVALIYSRTSTAKQQVEQNRAELVQKTEDLEVLRAQQDVQRRGLVVVKQDQAELQKDAIATAQRLEGEAKKAREQLAQYEQQIAAAALALIRNGANAASLGSVGGGKPIGFVGSTGNSTGPHTHFSLFPSSALSYSDAIDPTPYVANGTLSWPLKSFRITQGFGRATCSTCGYSWHNGIDLAAPIGTPIYAPVSGDIIMDKCFAGYGHAVVIRSSVGYVLLGHMVGFKGNAYGSC